MKSEIPEEVANLFEEIALDLIARGFTRFSSDAILHRIRWHTTVEKGDRKFKCNDHWTSQLSRRFTEKYPDFSGFFEQRRLPREKLIAA